MLAIRLRRQGKMHFATYRIVVQEAQKQPTSGRVVAYVGSYNPHSKAVSLDVAAAQKYLDNGAQPSPRVVKLLKDNGVKLPSWVREFDAKGAKTTRNPEKLRKNQPKAEKAAETPTEPAVETPAETAEADAKTDENSAETTESDAKPAE